MDIFAAYEDSVSNHKIEFLTFENNIFSRKIGTLIRLKLEILIQIKRLTEAEIKAG